MTGGGREACLSSALEGLGGLHSPSHNHRGFMCCIAEHYENYYYHSKVELIHTLFKSMSMWHMLPVIGCVTECVRKWPRVHGVQTVWQSDNCVIFFFSGAICFTVCIFLWLFIIFFLLLHSITFIVVMLYIFPVCGTDKGFKNKSSSAIFSVYVEFCCSFHKAEFWKCCGECFLKYWWLLIPKIYMQWVRICRIN